MIELAHGDGRKSSGKLGRMFSSTTTSGEDNGKRLNRWSANVTQPKSQGASQAMLYATGLDEIGMNKPQIGIASMWWSGNPCNMHLLDLSHQVCNIGFAC